MLDDAAVFSILSKCFAPVEKAEWEKLSAREAWAEFLDGARFILQNGGSLGLDKSPADYRRGNHAPLQDFLSECEVCALFCPPTYEEKRQFAARHFTGGLPESALPIESLYVNTAKAGDLLSPVDGKGMYLGTSARYMSALAERLGFGIPSEFSDCPDHLALELDVVAVLLRSGMVDEARTFLSERFNWLTTYRRRLINLGSEANFYVCLCDLLIGIVAEQVEDAA